MPQETTQACVLPTLERNRYFFGKPMTVRDFEAEQQYVIGKHRALNRLIHGAGILCGMQIQELKLEDSKLTVRLSEGAALDCCGNLIVVNRNSEKLEVKGTTSDGTFYLYVKFAECERQPIIASANTSNCEEVCSYNRIRETFEVFAVIATSDAGVAAGSNGAAAASQPVSQGEAAMAKEAADVNTSSCNELTQNYFEVHSGSCPPCDNPRVFLGIFTIQGSEVAINPNQEQTRRLRSVVFTNPMLHGLFCDHLTADNPHNTLQSINEVGFVPNIQLLHDDSITIDNNVADKKITIGTAPATAVSMVAASASFGSAPRVAREDHVHTIAARVVERKHLNNDVFERLVVSDGSITVTPRLPTAAGERQIELKTNLPRPATEVVTSVASRREVGTHENFAREDHVHDVAENLVAVEHLNDALFEKLLVSPDGSIGITHKGDAKPGDRQIELTAKLPPALTISGVGPNSDGDVRLVAGKNVTIAPDVNQHQLTINADFGVIPTAPPFTVTQGIVRFEKMALGERRLSPDIKHGLDATKPFAVVLGLDMFEGEEILIGDLSLEFSLGEPLLVANCMRGSEVFWIEMRDTRDSEIQNPMDYTVRWWAIPSTVEMEPVISPPPPR